MSAFLAFAGSMMAEAQHAINSNNTMTPKFCNFCDGAIPSPHHTQQCLRKPNEDWVAVANGERAQVLKAQSYYRSLKEQITFWQGKFQLVKHENNKLRARLKKEE